ncbi:MAG: hypothetical protein HZC40_21105 [Chloroflexi bacterium]|nr:hypothetical protein [Chloroflexota bacterium]
MKTRMLIGLVLALALAACAPAPTPTPMPTPVPPTATPVPPTATRVPPTATAVPPTATAVPTKTASEQCLTCHGNKDLAMKVGDESVPLFVNATAFAAGKHAKVECTACHTGINPVPPHNAKRTYGSWSRFSVRDTDTTKTRNYYTVTTDGCLKCHADAKYQAFLKSEHSTYKDTKNVPDGKPRQEIKKIGTDGKEYIIDENFVASDCERCHMGNTCATCHWKTQIKQKQAGNVLDLWTKYDAASDTTKGNLTEYAMDWTVNVATHEFLNAKALTSSNEVCQACHIGYIQGDKSVAALGIFGIGVRRHPQAQELQLSAQRGVHETQQICANCHKDLHEMVFKNSEHGARLGGKTQCTNCHADKAMKTATHKTVTCIGCHDAELTVQLDHGMVYPLALKHNLTESWPSHNLVKEVKCEKCHVAGNKVSAPDKVTPAKIH